MRNASAEAFLKLLKDWEKLFGKRSMKETVHVITIKDGNTGQSMKLEAEVLRCKSKLGNL